MGHQQPFRVPTRRPSVEQTARDLASRVSSDHQNGGCGARGGEGRGRRTRSGGTIGSSAIRQEESSPSQATTSDEAHVERFGAGTSSLPAPYPRLPPLTRV